MEPIKAETLESAWWSKQYAEDVGGDGVEAMGLCAELMGDLRSLQGVVSANEGAELHRRLILLLSEGEQQVVTRECLGEPKGLALGGERLNRLLVPLVPALLAPHRCPRERIEHETKNGNSKRNNSRDM